MRVLCLCPSVTQTPILAGCTATELADMRREVGGFMEPGQVAAAFIQLLRTGHSGAVMAVWKETAPNIDSRELAEVYSRY